MVAWRRRDPVRLTLFADASFELVVGVVLLAALGPLSDWIGLGRLWLGVLGGAFLLAALVIGAMALRRSYDPATVGSLALANLAGGVVLWGILLFAWGDVEPTGRWLVAAVADSFVLIGLLELVAVRLART